MRWLVFRYSVKYYHVYITIPYLVPFVWTDISSSRIDHTRAIHKDCDLRVALLNIISVPFVPNPALPPALSCNFSNRYGLPMTVARLCL